MSSVLSPQDLEFHSEYSERQSAFDEAAAHARTFVENALADVGLIPHAVTARAKDPSSLLEKLRRRQYADPASDIADLVGVRVITRYRDEVDHCAAALRNRLEVDDTRSVDKRSQLDLREFGYRSVHLIVPLADLGIEVPEETHDSMFEIQIRSILEHAWAENEHELYKSGIEISKESSRDFAAIAGTLELLDREFERLRSVVLDLEVEVRQQQIEDGSGSAATLDTAGIIAILGVLAPSSPGFLGSNSLPRSGATLLNEAFRSAGLTTANAVKLAFESDRFKSAAEEFAALSGLTLDELSLMAIGALLASTQADFPLAEFPDLLFDPNLVAAIAEDEV